MKIKFKIGDKVIGFRNDDNRPDLIGIIGTIDELDDCPFVLYEDGKKWCWMQDDLEYAEIYNSPLHKALREN